MRTLSIHRVLMPLLFVGLLPLAAPVANAKDTDIRSEISRDLADARNEVRAELADAAASWKPTTWNWATTCTSASPAARADDDKVLPKAEITPQGDFLIEGKPVAIDGRQRQDLLRYRHQVIDIAKAGIEKGGTFALGVRRRSTPRASASSPASSACPSSRSPTPRASRSPASSRWVRATSKSRCPRCSRTSSSCPCSSSTASRWPSSAATRAPTSCHPRQPQAL